MRNTPSSIEVILHYYYSPEPHPQWRTATVQLFLNNFIREGLIVPDSMKAGFYKTTPRGDAWVEMICHTPYPVEQNVWFDPRTNQPVEGARLR